MGQPIESPPTNRVVSALTNLLAVPYVVPFALLAITLAALLGNCVSGTDRLAFRDVSHFYTPLYGYIAARERTEWLPLYNDLDHTGIPLAGETTTAIFYPIRRIVFRLIDSPETAIAWYVALHLLLAGITAAWAARKAGASCHGASLAMLAYPLSGPIWFLYTNPPFLVGAAWLPLALAGGFALLRSFDLRDLTAVSAALALMILAGDPQTAIHVVLIGAGAWSIKTFSMIFGLRQTGVGFAVQSSVRSLLRLTSALVLAILLAAPQIAASTDWAQQSARYATNEPRSLHEIFAFSVPPWHWAELLVPSISGTLFPQYARISHLLPGDGRTWTITLYCGLIPFSLALLRYRRIFRLHDVTNDRLGSASLLSIRNRFGRFDGWDWIAPIGLVLAMGNLSIGAFLRWVQPQWLVGVDDLLLSPYGWLVEWLPGYSGFRYPAKWLVFVPLGITIAAARQFGHLTKLNGAAASRTATRLAMIGFLIAASAMIFLNINLAQSPGLLNRSDSIWGPLNYRVANWVVGASTLAVVCFAKLFDTITHVSINRNKVIYGLLVLTTFDLWLVARTSLATVNRQNENDLMTFAVRPAGKFDRPELTESIPLRAMRFSSRGWPSTLRDTDSDGEKRVLIAEASMRNSLFGRWHLAHEIAVFNSSTSLPPERLQSFWAAANAGSRMLADTEQRQYWNSLMQWLAIDQSWTVTDLVGGLASDASNPPITTLTTTPVTPTSPRVVWHREWHEIAMADSVPPDVFGQRLRAVVNADDKPDVPWIEILANQARTPNPSRPAASEIAALKSVSQPYPGHLRIMIESPVDGLVTVKQYHDGNFRAFVRRVDFDGTLNAHSHGIFNATQLGDLVEVHRCDFLFSAIKVPAGCIELQIVYSPTWKTPTLAAAGLGWGILLAGNLRFASIRRRKRTP